MQAPPTTVFIIDDDVSVLRALKRLLQVAGFNVTTFSSVDRFIDSDQWPEFACIIADIRMSGIDSMLLPKLLLAKDIQYPVIVLTGHDTPNNRAGAKQAGAVAFFRKPVDGQALVDSIVWAMRDPSKTLEPKVHE